MSHNQQHQKTYLKTLLIFLGLIFLQTTSFAQVDLNDLLHENSLINLPFTDSIGKDYKTYKIKIDKSKWEGAGFDKLEAYNSAFNYYTIGLVKTGKIKLLLIERQYTEESVHWICMINEEGAILDWLQTAYDNSEGFLNIHSQIDKDTITVKTWNDFAEIKSSNQKYSITTAGFKD